MRIPSVRRFMARERWVATRFMGRLGLLAGTLCGLALAFHLGGRDGYTVPLSFLLGYPTILLFRAIPGFALASGGPASEWSLSHLAWCLLIAANWTLIGVAMDCVRGGPAAHPPTDGLRELDLQPSLTPGDADTLAAAFDALEQAVKIRQQDHESSMERAA